MGSAMVAANFILLISIICFSSAHRLHHRADHEASHEFEAQGSVVGDFQFDHKGVLSAGLGAISGIAGGIRDLFNTARVEVDKYASSNPFKFHLEVEKHHRFNGGVEHHKVIEPVQPPPPQYYNERETHRDHSVSKNKHVYKHVQVDIGGGYNAESRGDSAQPAEHQYRPITLRENEIR